MKKFDVTDGLDTKVWDALNKAIELNQKDSISVFLSFFRRICNESLNKRNLKYFRLYIGFPARMYRQIYLKVKENSNYEPLVKLFSLELSLHLKEIIWFNIGLAGKDTKSIAEQKAINEFYYEAFKSFNALFYLSIRFQDWPMFHKALKDFDQLGEGAFTIDIQRRLKLNSLVQANDMGENNSAIVELEQQQKLADKYENYKRHLLSGIKYWCYLLFAEGIISDENLSVVLEKIKNYSYEGQIEIEDILFFRSFDLEYYMNWESWDYIDRPLNEVYSPPVPGNWMTNGFFLDRIRTNNAYFGTDKIDPSYLRDIPFLYDSLQDSYNSIRPKFDKWRSILKIENVEELDRRVQNLLSSVAQAKRIAVGSKEHVIANAPLNDDKIYSFKQDIGIAWMAQTRIRRIFDYFGNKEDVTGQDIKLKRVGQNAFLEKGKMVFIDGEYHSPIYGIEQFGGNIGRWEDELFFNVIQTPDAATTAGSTILETLTNAIKKLKDNGVVPNAILIEAQYLYKDEEFLNSKRYNSAYDAAINPDGLNFFVLGTFDRIPLFTSYSPLLKNKIVVAEFDTAFSMKYKMNDNWFENELSVDIELVTRQQAQERLIREPKKWKVTNDGIELSDQDAITLIETSIVIDVETIIDYVVKDTQKFTIGYITEPKAD